jgi:hypothetical protein
MTKNMTTTMTNTFTMEQGLQVQREHLNEWKQVLKEEVYDELVKYCMVTNLEARTGYDLKRGSELSTWIENYKRRLSKQ